MPLALALPGAAVWNREVKSMSEKNGWACRYGGLVEGEGDGGEVGLAAAGGSM